LRSVVVEVVVVVVVIDPLGRVFETVVVDASGAVPDEANALVVEPGSVGNVEEDSPEGGVSLFCFKGESEEFEDTETRSWNESVFICPNGPGAHVFEAVALAGDV